MFVALLASCVVSASACAGTGEVPTAAPASSGTGSFVTLAATVGGYARTATLRRPATLADGPVPLVIVLHGLGGSGTEQASASGFAELADAEGFLAVFPDGIDDRWIDESMAIFMGGPDDVAYLRQLVDQVDAQHPVDRSRVFVTGFSNGAGMSVRMACDAADLVAAVGPVSGGNVGETLDGCTPSEPVSVVQYHGTDDPIIRAAGGEGRLGDLRVPSFPVDDLAAFWATADGCAPTPSSPADPSAVAAPGEVTTRVWTGCADGTTVAPSSWAVSATTGRRGWRPSCGPSSNRSRRCRTGRDRRQWPLVTPA
ncbi:MAG: PHB depolymerase family esterase [Acidimicrobiales bacterium]